MQINNDYYIVVSLSINCNCNLYFSFEYSSVVKSLLSICCKSFTLSLLCFCVLFLPPLFHDNTLFNRFVTHYVTGDSPMKVDPGEFFLSLFCFQFCSHSPSLKPLLCALLLFKMFAKISQLSLFQMINGMQYCEMLKRFSYALFY